MSTHTQSPDLWQPVCPPVGELLAEADALLDASDTTTYWALTDPEFLEFTFPEWEVVAIDPRPAYINGWGCRALMRNLIHPHWWMYVRSSGPGLLPYRISTMGQYFRYQRNSTDRITYTAGTLNEIHEELNRSHRRVGLSDLEWIVAQIDATDTPMSSHEHTELNGVHDTIDALQMMNALDTTDSPTATKD